MELTTRSRVRTRRRMLKVKIKSLAEEARIIRKEELSCSDSQTVGELYAHRTQQVRDEQRSSLLAYGFLAGKLYHEIEPTAKKEPNWKRVGEIVKSFGVYKFSTEFSVQAVNYDAWLKEAKRVYSTE